MRTYSHDRFRPTLEWLENRYTPAGTVAGTFANGTWFLTGDSLANDFAIDGGGTVNANGVKNIVIKLGAGADRVQINSSPALLTLSGHLTINGGADANAVKIDKLTLGGNLSITNLGNLAGSDQTYLTDSLFKGHVQIRNGNGDTDTGIFRTSAGRNAIRGNFTVINGTGNDNVYSLDTHIGGNVRVKNGRPDANNEAGYTEIYNTYNATRSVIGGNVFVSYAAGTVDYDGIWDTEILGHVTFLHGAGEAETYIDGYTISQPVIIHGNLTIQDNGPSFISIGTQYERTGLIVGKNLNIATSAAADTLQIHRLLVNGSTTLRTRGGADTITIDDSRFIGPKAALFPIRILTGAGSDSVSIDVQIGTESATQFVRPLLVDLGLDNDTLTVGAAGGSQTRKVQLLHRATLAGGAGDDTLLKLNLEAIFAYPVSFSFEV